LDFDEAAVSELDLLLWFSPSWERGNFAHNGQPHHDYFVLFKKWSYDPDVSDEKRTSTLQLAHIPSIVIGLGDRKYPVFCGAVDMIEDFLTRSQSELIHASVRIDGYYFNTDRAHSQLDQLAIDISSIQK
jgi:sulfite reductase alpha subunit-like flavoprotein